MRGEWAIIPSNHDMAGFLAALDALDQKLAFADCTGHVTYATSAMQNILAAGGANLKHELKTFAASICQRMRHHEGGTIAQRVAVHDVAIENRRLTVTGSYVGFDLLGAGPTVIFSVEPKVEDPLSQERLRERFGLSRQESRVARLVTDGLSNVQIAERLCISPHTARHHTQRIMQKMGEGSRAGVISRLLRSE